MCFVFPACLAQQQEFKSQSWFSDQSIRSRCVPFIYLFIFAHVARIMDASWTNNDLPQPSLKTEEQTEAQRIAPWPVSAGPEGLLEPASNLQLGAGCCDLLLNDDPN